MEEAKEQIEPKKNEIIKLKAEWLDNLVAIERFQNNIQNIIKTISRIENEIKQSESKNKSAL